MAGVCVRYAVDVACPAFARKTPLVQHVSMNPLATKRRETIGATVESVYHANFRNAVSVQFMTTMNMPDMRFVANVCMRHIVPSERQVVCNRSQRSRCMVSLESSPLV